MSKVSISKQHSLTTFQPLKGGLIVSCQATDGTAIDKPEFLAAQAQTVLQAGAVGIRAQGIENVRTISQAVNVPVIGLVKRYLNNSPVIITALTSDVLDLEQAGANIVAVDATERLRPNGVTFVQFMEQLRSKTNIPILADIDSVESALIAEATGCNAVATTLSGYTDTPATDLPNINLVKLVSEKLKIPVIAEGGYQSSEQIAQAIKSGAWSVCLGTAITNPYLLTKYFLTGINDN